MNDRWEDQFVESYAEVRPEEFDEFHDAEDISDEEQRDLDAVDREDIDEFEDDDNFDSDDNDDDFEEEDEDYEYDIEDELE